MKWNEMSSFSCNSSFKIFLSLSLTFFLSFCYLSISLLPSFYFYISISISISLFEWFRFPKSKRSFNIFQAIIGSGLRSYTCWLATKTTPSSSTCGIRTAGSSLPSTTSSRSRPRTNFTASTSVRCPKEMCPTRCPTTTDSPSARRTTTTTRPRPTTARNNRK